MTLPLCMNNIMQMISWPKNSLLSATYDKLYLLKIWKDRRVHHTNYAFLDILTQEELLLANVARFSWLNTRTVHEAVVKAMEFTKETHGILHVDNCVIIKAYTYAGQRMWGVWEEKEVLEDEELEEETAISELDMAKVKEALIYHKSKVSTDAAVHYLTNCAKQRIDAEFQVRKLRSQVKQQLTRVPGVR